jgi:hypothetical protein
VLQFFDQTADVIRGKSSLLHMAVRVGRADIVTDLVDTRGFDPDAKDVTVSTYAYR